MKRRRRRKPGKPAGNKGTQAPPLQPAYPEEFAAEAAEESTPEEVGAESGGEQTEESGAETQAAAPSGRPKKRRRGGRGRKAGQQQAASAAPAQEEAPPESPASDSAAGIEPEAEPEREAAKPVPQVHAPHEKKRHPKGVVVLTIGLPGSGKTSWFRRRAITPLSSDLLRMMLFDDISEQRYQDLVFSTLRYLLRARMIARMPWNYVDATNLSPRERRGWIKMAQEFGYEVQAVFFDVPVEVCADRNKRRGRMVPDEVMQRMAAKLRPPTFEEGFTKITVVRVKKSKFEEPDNEVQGVEEHGPGMIDENY